MGPTRRAEPSKTQDMPDRSGESGSAQTVRPILALVILAALAASSFVRNEVWDNNMVLWEDAVTKSPNKGRAHHNLGRIYDRKGFFNEAFTQYFEAVSLDPGLPRAHESLGIAYAGRGQFDLARRELNAALDLDPNLVQARMFLQYIAMQEKQANQHAKLTGPGAGAPSQ